MRALVAACAVLHAAAARDVRAARGAADAVREFRDAIERVAIDDATCFDFARVPRCDRTCLDIAKVVYDGVMLDRDGSFLDADIVRGYTMGVVCGHAYGTSHPSPEPEPHPEHEPWLVWKAWKTSPPTRGDERPWVADLGGMAVAVEIGAWLWRATRGAREGEEAVVFECTDEKGAPVRIVMHAGRGGVRFEGGTRDINGYIARSMAYNTATCLGPLWVEVRGSNLGRQGRAKAEQRAAGERARPAPSARPAPFPRPVPFPRPAPSARPRQPDVMTTLQREWAARRKRVLSGKV